MGFGCGSRLGRYGPSVSPLHPKSVTGWRDSSFMASGARSWKGMETGYTDERFSSTELRSCGWKGRLGC